MVRDARQKRFHMVFSERSCQFRFELIDANGSFQMVARGLLASAFIESRATTLDTRTRRSRELRWITAIALIEMFVVAVTALFACLTYHSVVWGGLPDVPSYAAHSLTLAGLYGAICLVDDQYDLLGAAWNENGIQRGAVALVIAFVVFLTVLFLTDTIADYSRGTFVTQFLLTLPAQMAARGCLGRAVSRARKRGAGTGPGMVVLILPGVRNSSELLSLLPAYSEPKYGLYEVRMSDVELSGGSEVLEAQLTRIQDDCRRFRCDTVLVVCETDQLELINRTLFALWELPIRVRLLPIGLSDFLHRSQVAGYGRSRILEMRLGADVAARSRAQARPGSGRRGRSRSRPVAGGRGDSNCDQVGLGGSSTVPAEATRVQQRADTNPQVSDHDDDGGRRERVPSSDTI